MKINKVSQQNYPFLKEREGVWKEIVRYVSSDLGIIESILEIGAGYCDFINNFPAQKKICFEMNATRQKHASPEVDFRIGDAVNLISNLEIKVDAVFASNFLEHLNDSQLNKLLPGVYNILSDQGKLVLIQPNYRKCREKYFDDKTHQTIFSDENIQPFLKKYGFEVFRLIPGFLPFTMKSRLPKWPFLVRLYMHSPFRPNAAQMYVVAQKHR